MILMVPNTSALRSFLVWILDTRLQLTSYPKAFDVVLEPPATRGSTVLLKLIRRMLVEVQENIKTLTSGCMS